MGPALPLNPSRLPLRLYVRTHSPTPHPTTKSNSYTSVYIVFMMYAMFGRTAERTAALGGAPRNLNDRVSAWLDQQRREVCSRAPGDCVMFFFLVMECWRGKGGNAGGKREFGANERWVGRRVGSLLSWPGFAFHSISRNALTLVRGV